MNGHVTGAMVVRGVAFLICLIAFAGIAFLVSQPGIPAVDTAVTSFLHGFANANLDAIAAAVANLGSTAVLATVVAIAAVLLATRGRRAETVFIVVALAGSLVLNDTLKLIFHRSRPAFDWAQPLPEFGFPSGHTMNSFVAYVALALVVWRLGGRRVGTIALAVALALTGSVGITRIYLGAHWLSDVIGGYLAGTLWLLFLVAVWTPVSQLRIGRPHPVSRDPEGRPVPSGPAR